MENNNLSTTIKCINVLSTLYLLIKKNNGLKSISKYRNLLKVY